LGTLSLVMPRPAITGYVCCNLGQITIAGVALVEGTDFGDQKKV
jgi:hypothetical protein